MTYRFDQTGHLLEDSVSVIMPAYNAERFIAQAVESLLAQTFGNWHLIAINDGSTDGTPQILQRFTDPRITVIHQENRGEAAARNVGLAHAQGTYIAFLDADDLYLPNALQDHVRFLDAHPEFGVSFSDGFFCDAQDRRLMRLSEHRPGIYIGDILEALVLQASVITVPVCTMTRRSVVDDHHLQFDGRLVIGPDWDFWIHLARYTQFGYLDIPTCMYRIHATNITKTTGHRKRARDLLQGRLKIMNSEWFDDLSPGTRHDFFQLILLELLAGETKEQSALFQARAFRNLPAPQQANLFRLVAAHYLLRKQEFEFAQSCLSSALALYPGDRKSQALARLSRLGPGLCAAVLQGWRFARGVSGRIGSLGRRGPKPIPVALGPIAD